MTLADGIKEHLHDWPAAGLERIPGCPVCGSRRRRILHEALTDQIFYCAPGKWDLFRCSECGRGFLDPRPNEDTIGLAYRKYHTHEARKKPSTEALSSLRRMKRSLANGYRNWRFGTDFTPAIKAGIVVARLIPGQREKLEREFRSLPRPSPGARLLDVGFGNAAFLELARAAGWQVSGIDPDPVTVAGARERGLDVRLGSIEGLDEWDASFDVITMSHVIEHTHDPRAVVEKAWRLLKPGGRLWIETPNIDSYGHRRFGRSWRGLEPPRHLVIFTWKALQNLLREQSFENIKRASRDPAYADMAAKSKAIADGHDPYGRIKAAYLDHLTESLLRPIAKINPSLTEMITLVARKPADGRGQP